MKKAILALGLTLLVQGGLAGRLQAQQTGTRVAIINVGLVFSKYEKAMFYKQELETTLKPYKEKGEKINAEATKYGTPLKEKRVTDPKLKEQYEQYLLKLKRDMEDVDMEARNLIGKKQESQIITLYKEVIGAIQTFAQQNKYDLVLGYGQQIEGDMNSFANINRIMQGMDLGSTTPLFIAPVGGVDISQFVVDQLNARYRAGGGVAPAVPASTRK